MPARIAERRKADVSTLKPISFAALLLAGILSIATPAHAQSAAPAPASSVAPKPRLVLIPYQEPDGTNPHAVLVTKMLSKALTSAGFSFTAIAPVNHLGAVADAATICSQNNATGILVPEGRYEQTLKRFSISFFLTVLRYPTHAEFRLDDVSCSGQVLWSTVTTGDEAPSGVDSVGNLGAAVDGSFHTAVQKAVAAFAAARLPASISNASNAPIAAIAAPTDAPQPSRMSAYLLLPFGQPQLADPRAGDITHSLLLQMQKRKLNVTL